MVAAVHRGPCLGRRHLLLVNCCISSQRLAGSDDIHGLLCAGAAFSLLRLPKRALRLPSSSPSFFLDKRPISAVLSS